MIAEEWPAVNRSSTWSRSRTSSCGGNELGRSVVTCLDGLVHPSGAPVGAAGGNAVGRVARTVGPVQGAGLAAHTASRTAAAVLGRPSRPSSYPPGPGRRRSWVQAELEVRACDRSAAMPFMRGIQASRRSRDGKLTALDPTQRLCNAGRGCACWSQERRMPAYRAALAGGLSRGHRPSYRDGAAAESTRATSA